MAERAGRPAVGKVGEVVGRRPGRGGRRLLAPELDGGRLRSRGWRRRRGLLLARAADVRLHPGAQLGAEHGCMRGGTRITTRQVVDDDGAEIPPSGLKYTTDWLVNPCCFLLSHGIVYFSWAGLPVTFSIKEVTLVTIFFS